MSIRLLIWCPTHEGHLRYTHHLAVAVHHADAECGVGVLTTCPIPELYHEVDYEMQCANEPVRPAASLASNLHWFFDRVRFHVRQEMTLVRWMQSNQQCWLVHLQELHFMSGPLVMFLLKRWLRRKTVITVHNIEPHRWRRFSSIRMHRLWTGLALRQADALIVHDDDLRARLINRYRLPAVRVHTISHGVWEPDAANSATAEDTTHDPARPVLLFYGTIRPNKGLHHLLDAFARAPAHWRLVIAGSPQGSEHYFESVIEPQLTQLRQVGREVEVFAGFVPEVDVARYFSRADLLVLPYTDFAAQSGVLFDAIAYRLPVVCTPAGALGRTVKAWRIGEVARSADPPELLTAIEKLLAQDREQLARHLQAAAAANSWQHAGETSVQVYRALAMSKAAHPGRLEHHHTKP